MNELIKEEQQKKAKVFIPVVENIINCQKKLQSSKNQVNIKNIQVSQNKNCMFIKKYLNEQISYLFPWYQFNFFMQQTTQGETNDIIVSEKYEKLKMYYCSMRRCLNFGDGDYSIAKIGMFVFVHKLLSDKLTGLLRPYFKNNYNNMFEKVSFFVLQQLFSEKRS
eukprot:TRINITY_DN278_c1_g1_i1.p2 TRINITY_DN278_c1_g1~~TRINITY_DN278_c1_g1_i1.p2  ORF type:complete len:165 (-),score=7.23 TRINITY_DN278_c1_g1_i1:179-673(-)